MLFTYILLGAVIYVFGFFILPRFLFHKRYAPLIISTIIVWIIFLTADYLVEGIFDTFVYGGTPLIITISDFVIPVTKYFILCFILGFGHYYAWQLQQTQVERLEIEIAYLRAQINPHFLFNTLDFIAGSVESQRPEASRQIILLSELMRYSLHNAGNEKQAPLHEEIKQVQNLIALYQLRYEDDLQIQFNPPAPLPNCYIVPHLLLTLVENACKHGKLATPGQPITINVSAASHNLTLQVHNYKRTTQPDTSYAVGLSNIRRRLQLAYPRRFTIAIHNTDTTYQITINLNLNTNL
jgi:LytS/YehU family sensor histidine kinase